MCSTEYGRWQKRTSRKWLGGVLHWHKRLMPVDYGGWRADGVWGFALVRLLAFRVPEKSSSILTQKEQAEIILTQKSRDPLPERIESGSGDVSLWDHGS